MVRLLAGASVICMAMILVGVNRGFDISDEGLYVLLADPWQENVAGIFNYDFFFKLVFRVVGYSFSLVELRVFRLLSYFAGAWALAGFWKNISGESTLRTELFWISCLGLFAGYAFLPPTLSYNSLTVVLICFWLFLISGNQSTVKTTLFLGIILAVLVYVKVSLALFVFLLTLYLLFFRGNKMLLHSIAIFLPFVVFELLFFALFGENAISRLREGIPLNSQRSGYGVFLMVESIAVGGFWIILIGMLFFAVGYFQKTKSPYCVGSQIIAVSSAVVIGYNTHITDEWNHLILLFAAGFFGFQIGLGVFMPSKTNLWILLLLALPFLLHFGSNVYWLRIGVHYLVFWILAFKWMLRSLNWELSLATALLGVALVFNGIWWHPFGQEGPLWAEKYPWSRNQNETIQLEPGLFPILSTMDEAGMRQSPTPILAIYRIPGLVWLQGSTNSYSPAIWDRWQLEDYLQDKELPDRILYYHLDSLPFYIQQSYVFNYLGTFKETPIYVLWK